MKIFCLVWNTNSFENIYTTTSKVVVYCCVLLCSCVSRTRQSHHISHLSLDMQPWHNGSASDSSSEGCVFKSRPGHNTFLLGRGQIPLLVTFLRGWKKSICKISQAATHSTSLVTSFWIFPLPEGHAKSMSLLKLLILTPFLPVTVCLLLSWPLPPCHSLIN